MQSTLEVGGANFVGSVSLTNEEAAAMAIGKSATYAGLSPSRLTTPISNSEQVPLGFCFGDQL